MYFVIVYNNRTIEPVDTVLIRGNNGGVESN
jgi:hypothetical protein